MEKPKTANLRALVDKSMIFGDGPQLTILDSLGDKVVTIPLTQDNADRLYKAGFRFRLPKRG